MHSERKAAHCSEQCPSLLKAALGPCDLEFCLHPSQVKERLDCEGLWQGKHEGTAALQCCQTCSTKITCSSQLPARLVRGWQKMSCIAQDAWHNQRSLLQYKRRMH